MQLAHGDVNGVLQYAYEAVSAAADACKAEGERARGSGYLDETATTKDVDGSIAVNLLDETLPCAAASSMPSVPKLMLSVDLSSQAAGASPEKRGSEFSTESPRARTAWDSEGHVLPSHAEIEVFENRLHALAVEVSDEKQAREALAASFAARLVNVEEVIDRLTTSAMDFGTISSTATSSDMGVGQASYADNSAPEFSFGLPALQRAAASPDPATINLEPHFEAVAAETLMQAIAELKDQLEACASRTMHLEGRCDAFIAAQADSEEHKQALQSVADDVAKASDTHKQQFLKVTDGVNSIGSELRLRLDGLAREVAEHTGSLEGLHGEQVATSSRLDEHDGILHSLAEELNLKGECFTQGIAAAVKRIDDVEKSILGSVVGRLGTLADSIRKAEHPNVGSGRLQGSKLSTSSSTSTKAASRSPLRQRLRLSDEHAVDAPRKPAGSVAQPSSPSSVRAARAAGLPRSPSPASKRHQSTSPLGRSRLHGTSSSASAERDNRRVSPKRKHSHSTATHASVAASQALLPPVENVLADLALQGAETLVAELRSRDLSSRLRTSSASAPAKPRPASPTTSQAATAASSHCSSAVGARHHVSFEVLSSTDGESEMTPPAPGPAAAAPGPAASAPSIEVPTTHVAVAAFAPAPGPAVPAPVGVDGHWLYNPETADAYGGAQVFAGQSSTAPAAPPPTPAVSTAAPGGPPSTPVAPCPQPPPLPQVQVVATWPSGPGVQAPSTEGLIATPTLQAPSGLMMMRSVSARALGRSLEMSEQTSRVCSSAASVATAPVQMLQSGSAGRSSRSVTPTPTAVGAARPTRLLPPPGGLLLQQAAAQAAVVRR